MAIIAQRELFSWEDVGAESDSKRLELVLSALPDERLMKKLEHRRGRGRDDYPVRAVWNSIVAAIVFEHASIELLRRELLRNGELRQVCGFDPFLGSKAVPPHWVYSRFLKRLFEFQEEVEALFEALVAKLATLLPDFGRRLAADSKALGSFANGKNKNVSADGRRDTDADWGKKVYCGKREDGTLWEKVKRWFGYKVHLVVDADYELPLGFEVTRASQSDQKYLLPLLEKVSVSHPGLVERTEYVMADRGYDSEENNCGLYDTYGAKPIIDIRHMWKDPDRTRPLYPERADAIVYDENGAIYCVCPSTGETRELAFWGFEKERRTLKYRCPASAFGFECKGRGLCSSNASGYGRIVRVPIERNRRLFVPLPRSSYAWQREYRKRTAVERVNSRLDTSFGFEKHTIRGMKKMRFRVGLALAVMLALAVGSIEAGRAEQMRSLVKCLPKRAVA